LTLTLLGLVVSRVIIYVLMGKIITPIKPERKSYVECAVESLRMATELRIDATALYNQLVGKAATRWPLR